MKHDIKVTISGVACSGKSTVALILAQALQEHGIEFELTEDDDMSMFLANLDGRIDSTKQNAKVSIESTQINRIARA